LDNLPAPALYPIPAVYRPMTDFCLRVVGNSMCPELCAGDIVGIKRQHEAKSGQLVAAHLKGTLTLARWLRADGEWRLTPGNPAYPAIPIDQKATDCEIVGLVAWHFHDWLRDTDIQ
jgi:repressor LexA